jgi:hypothetical protein
MYLDQLIMMSLEEAFPREGFVMGWEYNFESWGLHEGLSSV